MNEIKKLMLEGIVLALDAERKKKDNPRRADNITKLANAFEIVWNCKETEIEENNGL